MDAPRGGHGPAQIDEKNETMPLIVDSEDAHGTGHSKTECPLVGRVVGLAIEFFVTLLTLAGSSYTLYTSIAIGHPAGNVTSSTGTGDWFGASTKNQSCSVSALKTAFLGASCGMFGQFGVECVSVVIAIIELVLACHCNMKGMTHRCEVILSVFKNIAAILMGVLTFVLLGFYIDVNVNAWNGCRHDPRVEKYWGDVLEFVIVMGIVVGLSVLFFIMEGLWTVSKIIEWCIKKKETT